MLPGEPAPSELDVRFSLFGIPIRVSPMFWVITAVLALNGPTEVGITQSARAIIWIGVVFVSILIHELGHAFAARAYGWQPWIVLHGFGGLAMYRPTYNTAWCRLLISAAGPSAGFALALLVVAVCRLVNVEASFAGLPLGGARALDDMRLVVLIADLLWVNIFWGLLNLLPVWPLDGGHIAYELLAKVVPRFALRAALGLSAVTAGGLAALIWKLSQDPYATFFFGYLAFTSLQAMSQVSQKS